MSDILEMPFVTLEQKAKFYEAAKPEIRTLRQQLADTQRKLEAALSTEAQGYPVYQIKFPGASVGVWRDASQEAYEVTTTKNRRILYTQPPSAIQAAVKEKLEEAARICDEIHWKWRIGDYSGPQECAEAIRALMESP